MTAPVTLYPAVRTAIPVGGTPVVAAYGPIGAGGFVENPYDAADQGIASPEALYVSFVGDAGLAANGTTFAVQPGGRLLIPPGLESNVSANAATSGHKFSAVIFQPQSIPVPSTGTFPPSGPTTLTKMIPSYPYEEYNDDEDVVAFFDAFNELSQEQLDWFVEVGLPIYTGLTGPLLDWVARGLYGMARPALPSGRNLNVGPLNTWVLNFIGLDELRRIGNQDYYATTDDVFKRILTWHFWKGDGKYFTVKWLKRRVMRFLTGTDGGPGQTDETYPVSVTFGLDGQVNITVLNGRRTVTGGAILNRFALNMVTPNQINSTFEPFPQLALAPIFKAAVESGALELPFQFTYVVKVT